MAGNMIIFDFGSQTTHLIARRLHDFGVKTAILDPNTDISYINKDKTTGIILSGGPASVLEKNSPAIDPAILNLGIPVLGICYGHQLIAHLLGGKVKPGKNKEYGPALLDIKDQSKLFKDIKKSRFRVWMSHGDEVVSPPPGFKFAASTSTVPGAFMQNVRKNIFSLQFHPEVIHTRYGTVILKNFVKYISGLPIKKKIINVRHLIDLAKNTLGTGQAIAAVSGGVDSTVAAAVVGRAIGINLIPVFIDNGLMRTGTREEITDLFEKYLHIPLVIVNAKKEFLQNLKSVVDPETKRKIIGKLYIRFFEKTAKNYPHAKYLIQGTIYSDVIESQGTKHADKIKSHHNVGGLPKNMKLNIYEPMRDLYKDEVRTLARKLGLPEKLVNKQPFPGPGQAIRIIGEVTENKLNKLNKADQIVLEEMHKSGWYKKVFQSFPILTDTKSTAVKGDARFYGKVMAIRIYNSSDIMTASWTRLPYDLLQKISSRIVNEVPEISRVVYDITTKPPATMEWE